MAGELKTGVQSVQAFSRFFVAEALFDDDKNSVVAGYRPQDFGYIAVIYVVSNAAGVARTCLDDSHVPREIDGDKARITHHFSGREWLVYALVHRFVGQHVDVFPVHAGCFGHFQLLQVAAQGGLRQLKALFPSVLSAPLLGCRARCLR